MIEWCLYSLFWKVEEGEEGKIWERRICKRHSCGFRCGFSTRHFVVPVLCEGLSFNKALYPTSRDDDHSVPVGQDDPGFGSAPLPNEILPPDWTKQNF